VRAYPSLFGRAFLVVLLTAANVRFIAAGSVLAMFVTGWAISYVWWWNSRTAAHSPLRGAVWAYSMGAGCGTVAGWWLAGLLGYVMGHL